MASENNVRHGLRVTALFAIALLVTSCGTSPAVRASASPTVYPVTTFPLPTLATGFGRFRGTVTDARTDAPLPGVCVVIATAGSCQDASPRTDANGFWWIDVPAFVDWDFGWTKDGYQPFQTRLQSPPGEQVVNVALVPRS